MRYCLPKITAFVFWAITAAPAHSGDEIIFGHWSVLKMNWGYQVQFRSNAYDRSAEISSVAWFKCNLKDGIFLVIAVFPAPQEIQTTDVIFWNDSGSRGRMKVYYSNGVYISDILKKDSDELNNFVRTIASARAHLRISIGGSSFDYDAIDATAAIAEFDKYCPIGLQAGGR
ncbi:hypothetical protein [Oharaeibacter diazotrophicus]|uniref:hypothetical protein n=1 Tax=Oharaeibacter diazotrophicus TaxID=1920512 RepID=UPI000F83CA40|nr:hypothetical protein [Oharaeibacter diazotrophicus]GLS75970.1 hypothetical protein GCM10007904_13050 [Oharaeibacter diazotrophicus]